jgi:chromosome segregation ATPase
LRQNIHTLEEQLHQHKTKMQELNAKLMTENQEKIRITERAAALEERRQEHQAENQRLHQLLKHVQENLEHYQAATQKLREEQSLMMEKQRNEYEQKLSSLLVQANFATSEKSAIQTQYDQQKKAYESLAIEHKTFEKQHAMSF